VASGNWASWRSGGVFRVADNDDRSGSIKMCEEAGGREEESSSRSRADRRVDYALDYHRDNGGTGRGEKETSRSSAFHAGGFMEVARGK